eukprot:scaffold7675_cov277-Pinguiococcus_pyrenoidosus.AAC.7
MNTEKRASLWRRGLPFCNCDSDAALSVIRLPSSTQLFAVIIYLEEFQTSRHFILFCRAIANGRCSAGTGSSRRNSTLVAADALP